MAFVYYKYLSGFTNTIVAESPTPFTLGPGESQIFTSFEIPAIQPLYLYAVSGIDIVANTDPVINQYLASIGQQSSETIFTGYTATTQSQIIYLSGQTAQKLNASIFDFYSGSTKYASGITMSHVPGSTYTTIQDFVDVTHSSGVISGLDLIDIGGGSVQVTSGTTIFRINSGSTSTIVFVDYPGEIVPIPPDGNLWYLGLIYNNGNPEISLATSDMWNNADQIQIGNAIVLPIGTLVFANPHTANDMFTKIIQRLESEGTAIRDERVGGLILGETGTRNVTLTSGAVWAKLNNFNIAPVDTSGSDILFNFYYSGATSTGATWIVNTDTQWDDLHYNDTTNPLGLVALTNGYYTNLWFYLSIDSGLIGYVYGQAQYSGLTEASAEGAPSFLPPGLSSISLLVGRYIIRKSGTTASAIDSAFKVSFNSSVSTTHNNLSGLQGGGANEYYHLTLAKYIDVQNTTGLNTGDETASRINTIYGYVPQSQAIFTGYTATTAPNQFASKVNFNLFTGTTAPATYLTKSSFNTYSGATLTNINSRLLTSAFNSYSASTLTNIQSRLLTSAFNTYSASTLTNIQNRLLTSNFNTYSAATQTTINGKLNTSDFNVYSANTISLIQASQAGLDPKQSVRVATTVALSGGTTYIATGGTVGTGRFTSAPSRIDGIILANNNRVLVKNQADPRQNGIYSVISTGVWNRSADMDGVPATEVSAGNFTFVETGATNTGSGWVVTGNGQLTLNTDPILWTKYSSIASYTPGVGITISGTVIAFDGANVAGNALTWSGTQLNVNPTGGTLGTKFNTKLDITAFNVYSAATLTNIQSRLLTSAFNTYSGNTANLINTKLNKTVFNTYTGTTAPATYLSIANFNPYSASTLTNIQSRLLTSAFNTYSGNTANLINTKLNKTVFNTYTGTTAPATYLSIVNFNSYSASTLTNINTRVLKTVFSTYTGTTAPATYLAITAFNTYSASTLTNINSRLLTSNFNTYSASTLTNINSRLLTSAFNTYSGQTAVILNTKVDTANNGLTKVGRNVRLGGTFTGATTIVLGTSSLTFSGTTGLVKYATDQSANFDKRTHIDQGYFTGNTLQTRSQLLVYSSGTTDLNVTTPVSIPFNRLIRNNSTVFTYSGGTTIKILVAGTYDVSYIINGTNSNGTAHSISTSLYKNGSSVAETTSACGTVGSTGAGASMALPPTQITFAANDVIQIRGFRLIAGGGSFNITANSVFLSIVKKY